MTSEQDLEEQKILLQKEYSSYLDSSVVLAITNDYDSLDDARVVLEQLKEATAFDDPGPSGFGTGDNNSSSDWGNNYNNFDDDTPETSVSVRSNDGDSPASGEKGGGADAKMAQLASMFPKFSLFTLRHTLDKCQGDVDRAVDELLNRCFLDEEGEGGKGIDGFAEDMMLALPSPGGKRKGKGKNKRKNSSELLSPISPTSGSASDWSDSGLGSVSGSGSGNQTKSKWTSVSEEVAYLSRMLNLPKPTVASAYHENGSLRATVLPLVKAHGKCETMPEDAAHLENVHNLLALLPKLPQDLANGVLKLTKGNVNTAEELSRYMLQSIGQQLLPPMPLSPLSSDDNGSGTSSNRKQAWQTVSSRRETSGPLSPVSPTGPRFPRFAVRDAAASEFAARNEAFDKAHAAYRRSKSDKLFGAVATHYAEAGRSHNVRAKALGLEAAEALVDDNVNTIPGESLDLHGVTVQQAIKITRERVTQWWVSAGNQHGEDRIIQGMRGQGGVSIRPFRIITGKGTHSRNGETKLGPAVAKMLVSEKWKIEVRNGYITVFGVANRK